jgi:hypothetical protein
VAFYWGDYSTTEAILILINAAMAASERFDYFVFLSGVDYPVRTPAQLEAYFLKYRGSEFINMVAMPSEAASKPLSRLIDYKPRPGIIGKLTAQVRRLLAKAGIISRTRDYKAYFGGLTPYAGSMWWALTHQAFLGILPLKTKYAATLPTPTGVPVGLTLPISKCDMSK